MLKDCRIVVTGIGLAAPNGNNLSEFRHSLLNNISGINFIEHRYIGRVPAGICNFDTTKYQTKKDLRTSTRAGSISIYCAGEAINHAGIDLNLVNKSRIGIFIGTTEHGTVETEQEIHKISQYNFDISLWNHYHNPRSISNNPAGEISIRFGITGPHYCIGAACAAGNAGIIQGVQQLLLNEVDIALSGGVSECTSSFGIFASFKSQNALAYNDEPEKASRPFDKERNGIVVSEGGAIFVLERLDDALKRGAEIIAEVAGYSINSDGCNYVMPCNERQTECMLKAISSASITPDMIDLVNTHATGTVSGDAQEVMALKNLFKDKMPYINNTKGFIGHTMGAAGALELAGNIPSFYDDQIHPCMNLINKSTDCDIESILITTQKNQKVNYILNNSFGMLGINSVVILKKYTC